MSSASIALDGLVYTDSVVHGNGVTLRGDVRELLRDTPARHLTGLENRGNQCYANAATQLVRRMWPDLQSSATEGTVLHKIFGTRGFALPHILWTNDKSAYLSAATFNNWHQHDMEEFLRVLLNQGDPYKACLGFNKKVQRTRCGVQQDATYEKDWSIMCPLPNQPEPMNMSSLVPYPEVASYAVRCVVGEENVPDGIQDTTSLTDVKKYVIVQLKRFEMDIGRTRKIVTPVRCNDLELGGNRYRAVCCIRHIGETTGSGHYIACVRYGDLWFQFDDDQVRHINEVPLDGYVFLYERIY